MWCTLSHAYLIASHWGNLMHNVKEDGVVLFWSTCERSSNLLHWLQDDLNVLMYKDGKWLVFPTPSLFDVPTQGNASEFLDENYSTKTRGMGLVVFLHFNNSQNIPHNFVTLHTCEISYATLCLLHYVAICATYMGI